MGITLGGYDFDGPYTSTENLEDRAGVFAAVCLQKRRYFVLDVGQSEAVKSCVEDHERQACWRQHCSGKLGVAVHYAPGLHQADRTKIEQQLRRQYKPPCNQT